MLQIGWASADVSTNEAVGITGQAYERISTGSVDPTTVTVLYLESGVDSVVFISADFTSFQSDFFCELKNEVKQKIPEVDPNKIILNATHTHTAPRYQLTTGYDLAPRDRIKIEPPEKYRRFLLDRLVDTIGKAYGAKSPGSFSYGLSSAEVSVQRRCVYFNDKGGQNTADNTFAVHGHAMMYGKTNLDDFSGYEGCLDTNVYFLFTFDEKENLTGAIINVPCPSQCTEHENFTSADYWNEARKYIRERYGNIYILPQCACAGDLSPHVLHGKEALKRRNLLKFGDREEAKLFSRPLEYYNRMVLGERIAHAFDECYSWAKKEKISEAEIVHKTMTIPLESLKIDKENYLVAKNNVEQVKRTPFRHTDDPLADFKENTKISCNINRYMRVIDRYEENREYYDTEIHVLKLGEIAFATNPFELYLDYQHRIQGRSPFPQTFMIQLAASSTPASGYLATEKAVKNKGYSAIPFSCFVSPEGGNTLTETIVKELFSLWEEK